MTTLQAVVFNSSHLAPSYEDFSIATMLDYLVVMSKELVVKIYLNVSLFFFLMFAWGVYASDENLLDELHQTQKSY